MKPILYMAAAIAMAFVACKKDRHTPFDDGTRVPKTAENLKGTWKEVAYELLDWQPSHSEYYISFSSDGSLTHERYTRYLLDSTFRNGQMFKDTFLLFYKGKGAVNDSLYVGIEKLTKDSLQLSRIFCFEGCRNKFVRVK